MLKQRKSGGLTTWTLALACLCAATQAGLCILACIACTMPLVLLLLLRLPLLQPGAAPPEVQAAEPLQTAWQGRQRCPSLRAAQPCSPQRCKCARRAGQGRVAGTNRYDPSTGAGVTVACWLQLTYKMSDPPCGSQALLFAMHTTHFCYTLSERGLMRVDNVCVALSCVKL